MSGHLQFEGVSKRYPGVWALDGVSFDVCEGRVHALLGQNGAGKSTLLRILSGACAPSAGRVWLGGEPRVFRSTNDALAAGVSAIYQELHLVPEMTVEENLYLGHLPAHFGVVDRGRLRGSARRQLEALGEDIDPGATVGSLSVAARQMLAIAKALTRDAKVIAFDEPTSSLSRREVDRLFAVIAELRRQRRVVLYVSHRLEEIFEVCDAVTVLRDGRHVKTLDSLEGASTQTLIRDMVGREIRDVFHYAPRPRGAPALEVAELAGPGLSAPASFSVARGEVLGFFGLVGAGRTELLKLVFGATRASSGELRVEGGALCVRRPPDAVRAGIAYCPEDRQREGIVGIASVMENLNLVVRRQLSRLGFVIDERRERENARRYVEQLSVKTTSLAEPVRNLSGGNQQKVVLGRWLAGRVKVMLLDEPTRGIAVGAKSEIYSLIYDLAREGVGVVVCSSELPELLGICDRIVVMRQGRIVASLAREEATPEAVLALALPASERRAEAALAS